MLASMSEIDPRADLPLVDWSELGVSGLLPTGTVTLLLADVEGSTRLWETQPERDDRRDRPPGSRALRDRRRPWRGAPGRAGRRRQLRGGVRPRQRCGGVRAGVAAGAAGADPAAYRRAHRRVQLRDEGNYIGPTINRTARLRDLAHGGQTVLSGTTEALVCRSAARPMRG